MLPEMVTFGDGKILGEGGVADQTNSVPLSPKGLSMTSLLAEVDGTAVGTVSEGTEGVVHISQFVLYDTMLI
jgi:hypothetical protein